MILSVDGKYVLNFLIIYSNRSIKRFRSFQEQTKRLRQYKNDDYCKRVQKPHGVLEFIYLPRLCFPFSAAPETDGRHITRPIYNVLY
jgi:ribosomal protein S14